MFPTNRRHQPPPQKKVAINLDPENEDMLVPSSTLPSASLFNTQQQQQTSVEDLLSAKLNSMSLDERTDGLHDLHGVSDVREERPEMLRTKVQEMNQVLFSIVENSSNLKPPSSPGGGGSSSINNTQPYEKALRKSQKYVESLKIPLLRAERFDPQKAAERMILFFARKLELFGEDCLARDIIYEDLNDDEKRALQDGVVQVLKQRDRSGRAILFIHGRTNVMYSQQTVARVFFYIPMSMLQDQETQRAGVVSIYYANHQSKFHGRPQEFWKTSRSIPWWVVAVHFCQDRSNNPGMNLVTYTLCTLMRNRNVCRFRIHTGTDMEVVYKLMTFGIPKEVIPINFDNDSTNGMMNLENHQSMLGALRYREKQRQQQQRKDKNDDVQKEEERTTNASSTVGASRGSRNSHSDNDHNGIEDEDKTVLVPGPMDILMGRSKRARSNPGALRMWTLMMDYKEEYDNPNTTKFEKTIITESILQSLKQSGCRFLKPHQASTTKGTTSSLYEICDDLVARDKISNGFRNLRRVGRKCNNNITTDSLAVGISPTSTNDIIKEGIEDDVNNRGTKRHWE